MAGKKPDQFADFAWNPIVGCTPISVGCENCWAATHAGERFYGALAALHYEGATCVQNGKFAWAGKLILAPSDRFRRPLKFTSPRTILVCSMGDLFHEDVPVNWLNNIFAVMARASQHTFIILTKRAKRMRDYIHHADVVLIQRLVENLRVKGRSAPKLSWPLPNVWLGVSVEDQANANARLPHLLETPAALRFVACEPLLDAIDLTQICDADENKINALSHIDWIIIGGEHARVARPMPLSAACALAHQCEKAQKPIFVSRLGSKVLLPSGEIETFTVGGVIMDLWPRELQCRQHPAALWTEDSIS